MMIKRFNNFSVNEKYSMDSNTGDAAAEHAKLVIDTAFEKHKKDQDGMRAMPQLNDAFRQVTKGDAQLEGATKEAMVKILENLLNQAKSLKVGAEYDPKKNDPYNPENW